MSTRTQAFFVASSGRSGTAMLQKALSAVAGVAMNHEYAVQITQPLAVQRYLGLVDPGETKRVLSATHAAAVRCSNAAHWGDSSNKVSWLIPDLAELLPEARFVHLVRDGRKVTGSYFRKLAAECYDDRATEILQAHYDDPLSNPAPPPEKRYWWPVPRKSDPLAEAFRHFDQFTRIAWHWAEINKVILSSLSRLAPERTLFVRLEDLRQSPRAVQGLFRFLNLPYRHDHFHAFERPHNVNRPEDRVLDKGERARFEAVANSMMERLGYANCDEYVVKY